MPFRSRDPILHLETASLTTVDTNNVMNLHGLWSVFSRCAETLEEGKRLENLSWRVFSREAFVCRFPSAEPQTCLPRLRSKQSSSEYIPELSSSLDSNTSSDSDSHMELATRSCPTSARPELRRTESTDSRNSRHARQEKHISPLDLEKIVNSIKENTELSPLSPLPASLSLPATKEPEPAPADHTDSPHSPEITPTAPSRPAETSSATHIVPDSSTSTVATAVTASDISEMSPPLAASESTSTEISATSIVRGFSKEHISSCYRSHTQLAPTPTQSILKASPVPRAEVLPKKKTATKFIVGGSSGEGDESSFETRFGGGRSSLSEGLRRSNNKKTTSFRDEVSTRMIQDRAYESEEVFEESDEEEDQSESAIEDEDVDEEWEDEEEPSSPPRMDEKEMFQRVDSRPNLTSRRSLLTTQLHEGDRAAALQNAASKSTSALRRSRNQSPNGPMGSTPPQNIPPAFRAQASRARPIILTTSNTHPPALSPRTTRRNMLQTELTESLRKHLLWERQVKGSTTNAVLKRRHTSNDIKNLKEYPNAGNTAGPALHFDPANDKLATNASSWDNYFDSGLQEYHQKGW